MIFLQHVTVCHSVATYVYTRKSVYSVMAWDLVFLQAVLLPVSVDSVYVKYLTKGEVIIFLFPNCRYLDMYAGL